MPALAPVGRTDLLATTVIRMRPVATEESLRRVREDRAHIEAELASVRHESDRRVAVLEQEAAGTRRLESDLVGRRSRLWDVLVGFRGRGRSGPEAERSLRSLQEDLPPLGYRLQDSRFRASALTAALEPGGRWEADWGHPLPQEGLACLLPLWEDRLEERGGVLVGVHADHGTPVIVNRFVHPSHSSVIFGETGSGKSYASALGWMRLRYFHPDLSVMVLDPLGGLAEVVRALGGEVIRVGSAALRINPLDPATTGGDTRAKAARVGVMFRAMFPSLTDEESALVDTALSRLYARPGQEAPVLSDLVRSLGGLAQPPTRLLRLLSTAVEGSLRGLDGATQIDLASPLLGFDLSRVTSEELPFFLTLLLDLVYGEVRRRPGKKLVVLDEAHYLARSPATASFLDYLVRHVRHFEAGLELLSQNPEDFLRGSTGGSVLMNVDSATLLRLRDGGAPVAELLGLTANEVDFVRKAAMPKDRGYSEGIFRSGGLHFPLAVIASDEEDAFLRQAFRSERPRSGLPHGSDPPALTPSDRARVAETPKPRPLPTPSSRARGGGPSPLR